MSVNNRDMIMKISVGENRTDKNWKNIEITWGDFCGKVRNTLRTKETMAEYSRYSPDVKTKIKDVGGFVGGTLADGLRTKRNVLSRSMLTFDMDNAKADTWEKIRTDSNLNFACCVYSTHKHRPNNPRYRLVIPLAGEITPNEYIAVSRIIAHKIGIDLFDDTTYEPNRMMFWPSTSSDGEFFYDEKDGEFLDPQKLLNENEDWNDDTKLPHSMKEKADEENALAKNEDPTTKKGIVGAFCRTYSVTDAITTFLPEIYAPTANYADRFSYIPADSSAGLIVYDDKFAYSHHATDPAHGRRLNAFDLVRIHLYGELDEGLSESTRMTERPSYKAMCGLAKNDDTVTEDLKSSRNGDSIPVLTRLEDILRTDQKLQNIHYNQNSHLIDFKGLPEWMENTSSYRTDKTYSWDMSLMSSLMTYVSREHNVCSVQTMKIALLSVANERAYHPIKEYLENLPPWDGKPRVDNLLNTYFVTDDNAYTRQAMRKTLVAAVARVYEPGTKFDTVLVLCGAQGIQKSTFFNKLGMEWFSDSLTFHDMKDKTSSEKLQGVWIMEMSELAGCRKAELETIKKFISSQSDDYRECFATNTTKHPRQGIIVGTTNADDGFLRDPTGGRRFWPVNVSANPHKKPRDMTTDEIAQIWAEALIYYRRSEPLILDDEAQKIALNQQKNAVSCDPRQGIVELYLDKLLPVEWNDMDINERINFLDGNEFSSPHIGTVKRTHVSYMEIWCECFKKDRADYKRSDGDAISLILNKIGGWEESKQIKLKIYGNQRCRIKQA